MRFFLFITAFICSTAMGGASASEHVAEAFAAAMLRGSGKDIILIERLSEGELLEMANDRGFSLQDLKPAFDGIGTRLFFRVIDSVSGDNIGKHLFVSQPFRTGMRRIPEVGTSVFVPDAGTQWILIMEVNQILNENKEIDWVYKGNVVDNQHGLLPSGDSRVIEGLNGLVFLKDLKAIRSAMNTGDIGQGLVDSLEAPVSGQVLLNVLKKDAVDSGME